MIGNLERELDISLTSEDHYVYPQRVYPQRAKAQLTQIAQTTDFTAMAGNVCTYSLRWLSRKLRSLQSKSGSARYHLD